MEPPSCQDGVFFDISIVKEEYEVQEWDDCNTNSGGDFSAFPEQFDNIPEVNVKYENEAMDTDESEYIRVDEQTSDGMIHLTDLSIDDITEKSLESMTPDKFFNCCVCSKRFKYNGPKDVRKHMIIHMKDRPSFDCDSCDKSFLWEESLVRHKQRCTGKVNGDPESPADQPNYVNFLGVPNFESSRLVDFSEQPTTSQGMQRSSAGQEEFSLPPSMQPSTIQMRRDPQMEYTNNTDTDDGNSELLSTQNNKTDIGNHLLTKRILVCKYCGNKYTWMKSYRQHELICKQIATEPKFSCKTCGNRYHEQVSLLGHKQICRRQNRNIPNQQFRAPAPRESIEDEGDALNGDQKIIFQCGFCGNTYKTKKIMRKHEFMCQTNKEVPKYSCNICGNKFHRSNSLLMHKNVCKFQIETFSRTLPDVIETTEVPLEPQAKEPNPEQQEAEKLSIQNFKLTSLLCHNCGEIFTDRISLMMHQKNECQTPDGFPQYSCGYCSKGFFNENSMSEHYSKCTISRADPVLRPGENKKIYGYSEKESPIYDRLRQCYICAVCKKEFKDKYHMINHMVVHWKDKPQYSCEICPKKFLWKCDLEHHKELCFKPVSPGLSCDTCGKGFKKECFLESHIQICRRLSQQKPIEDTPSVVAQPESLLKVIENKTRPPTPEPPQNPPEPQEEAADEVDSSHDDTQIHECQLCGKTFSTLQFLKIHTLSHTNPETTFPCDICGNLYRQPKTLVDHRKSCQSIGGTPQFNCLICGNKYHENRTMVQHRKTCRMFTLRQAHLVSDIDNGVKNGVNTGVKTEERRYRTHRIKQEYTVKEEKADSWENGESNQQEDVYDVKLHDATKPNNLTIQLGAESLTIDECVEMTMLRKTKGDYVSCNICHKVLKGLQKFNIRHHMYTHFKDRPTFSCRYCSKTYLWNTSKISHEQTCVDATTKIPCDHCGLYFDDQKALQIHRCNAFDSSMSTDVPLDVPIKQEKCTVDEGTQRVMFKCEKCGMIFKNMHRLVRHENVHGSRKTFSCTICGNRYLWMNDLKIHYKKCQLFPNLPAFPCEICGNKYHTETSLNTHKKFCNGLPAKRKEDNANAKEVEKMISKIEDDIEYQMEENEDDSDANSLYSCPTCGKDFISKLYMRIHLKRHEDNINTFTCDICSNHYKYQRSLIEHQDECAKKKDKPQFSCLICGNKFHYRLSMTQHKNTCGMNMMKFAKLFNIDEKDNKKENNHVNAPIVKEEPQTYEPEASNWNCDERSSNNKEPLQLDVNLKVIRIGNKDYSIRECVQMTLDGMTPDKVFTCIYCKKQYKYNGPSELTKHMSIHMKNRPSFPCKKCGRTFFWEKSHTRHEEQCSRGGKKSFVTCIICHKASFLTKQEMDLHMLVHTRSKRQKWQVGPAQMKTNYELTCKTCGLRCKTEGSLNTHEGKCKNMAYLDGSQTSHDENSYDDIQMMGIDEGPGSTYRPEYEIVDVEDSSNEREQSETSNITDLGLDDSLDIFECQKCDKMFSDKKYLDIHMTLHTNPQSTYTCDICGNVYRCKQAMNDHRRACQMAHTPPRFMCLICGNKFQYKTTMEQHRKTCSGLI